MTMRLPEARRARSMVEAWPPGYLSSCGDPIEQFTACVSMTPAAIESWTDPNAQGTSFDDKQYPRDALSKL
jgi:hypothetical protein